MNAIQKQNQCVPADAEKRAKVVKEQIPDLESSVQKIKDMVAKFDPKTIEDINAFKTKYEKEYKIAQDLLAKVSTMLEGAGVNVPKLF